MLTDQDKKQLEGLERAAQDAYKALGAGIRGGVSQERLKSLEADWIAKHKAWWGAVDKALDLGATP